MASPSQDNICFEEDSYSVFNRKILFLDFCVSSIPALQRMVDLWWWSLTVGPAESEAWLTLVRQSCRISNSLLWFKKSCGVIAECNRFSDKRLPTFNLYWEWFYQSPEFILTPRNFVYFLKERKNCYSPPSGQILGMWFSPRLARCFFQKSLKSMYDASHFDLRFGISRNICNKITGQLKEL